MGTFRVGIEIGDPQGQRFEPVEALVDTGASDTALPASFLRRLGVAPDERAAFELASGETRDYDIGQTWIRINGRKRMAVVVFAEEDTEPLLGASTLELFGLGIDPVRRRLVPVRRLLK